MPRIAYLPCRHLKLLFAFPTGRATVGQMVGAMAAAGGIQLTGKQKKLAKFAMMKERNKQQAMERTQLRDAKRQRHF